ncbi:hypothetical protein BLA29_011331, partial [Euroglyphus maynei]
GLFPPNILAQGLQNLAASSAAATFLNSPVSKGSVPSPSAPSPTLTGGINHHHHHSHHDGHKSPSNSIEHRLNLLSSSPSPSASNLIHHHNNPLSHHSIHPHHLNSPGSLLQTLTCQTPLLFGQSNNNNVQSNTVGYECSISSPSRASEASVAISINNNNNKNNHNNNVAQLSPTQLLQQYQKN